MRVRLTHDLYSAHRIASAMALTVAGIRAPLSSKLARASASFMDSSSRSLLRFSFRNAGRVAGSLTLLCSLLICACLSRASEKAAAPKDIDEADIGAELKYYRGAVLHMPEYLVLVPDAPDAQAAKDEIIIWKDKTTHP